MELSFTRPNGAIDQAIEDLIKQAEGVHHPKFVREMIISALKAGQETDYLADLKMLNNTMKEKTTVSLTALPTPAGPPPTDIPL